MWRRREEGLRHWLTSESLYRKPGFALKFSAWFFRGSSFWNRQASVQEPALVFSPDVICCEDALSPVVRVQDALATFCHTQDRGVEETREYVKPSCRILEAELLEPSGVRTLHPLRVREMRIHEAELGVASNSQSLVTSLKTASVRTMQCLGKRPLTVRADNWRLPANPAVRIMTPQLSRYPHVRVSADIEKLPVSEQEGFLREAEILKGVPAEKGELLAVFRCVPIELISQLRFLAEKRIILYTISNVPGRTRTRLHDMAAIRDTSSQEVHLVPHRTKCHSVSLN